MNSARWACASSMVMAVMACGVLLPSNAVGSPDRLWVHGGVRPWPDPFRGSRRRKGRPASSRRARDCRDLIIPAIARDLTVIRRDPDRRSPVSSTRAACRKPPPDDTPPSAPDPPARRRPAGPGPVGPGPGRLRAADRIGRGGDRRDPARGLVKKPEPRPDPDGSTVRYRNAPLNALNAAPAARRTAAATITHWTGKIPRRDIHEGVVGIFSSKSVPWYLPRRINGTQNLSTKSGSKYWPCPPA